MTHRPTREDTIQSIYIYISSSPLDFSQQYRSQVSSSPRIEFRPLPSSPFTSGNKCTYDSIMRPESWPEEKCSEDRVQLSTFHFQRYTSGDRVRSMRTDRERSIRHRTKIPSISRTSKYLFFFSPSLLFSLSLSRYLFLFAHNHVQSPLLLWTFPRDPGAGVPRRRFPEEISNGLTVLVSFST